MPKELVITLKPLDTSGSHVRLGLAELFLPDSKIRRQHSRDKIAARRSEQRRDGREADS